MNFALCFHIICQKTVERLWLSVEQDVTDRSQVRMFIYLLFFCLIIDDCTIQL